MSEPSTPAAGSAATPAPEAETPAVPEAPARRSEQVKVTSSNGAKVVTIHRGDKTVTIERPAPKAGKPAPAADASQPQAPAGKTDGSAPATAAKGSTTAPPPPNGSQQPPPKSSASDKPAASTPAPEKKPDEKPPLSKGWAAMLEREAQATKRENDAKATEAKFAPFAEAQEIGKTSKLKAIEKAFGWKLEDLQNEYLGSLEGTLRPEQIAERTARKVIEDREAAAEEARKKTETEQAERVKAEAQERVNASYAGLLEHAKTLPASEMEGINTFGLTPYHTIKFWADSHGGEFPTAEQYAAALKEHEASCQARLKAAGFSKQAPAPAAEPATPANRTAPTVRVKGSPNTITSEDHGEVPISRRPQRKETAIERANRLVAERLGN
jgi:hypothetical protein